MKDRVKYFLIFGISLLLIGSIGMSFALFTTDTERKGALNIVAVNTSCPLESEELNDNNQITLGANEEKKITVKLTNASLFDVKSIITYKGTDVEVTYDTTSKDNISIEELPINEERKITLYIKNNSQRSQTVTINAKCGFIGKDIILEEGEKQVENEYVITVATLRNWPSDSTDDFHNSTYKSKITSIEFKTNTSEVPSNSKKTWSVKDSTSKEEVKAYLLANGSKYYKVIISTPASVLYANPDSSYMFGIGNASKFSNLEEIKGLELLDTSSVTDMSNMFSYCSRLSDFSFLANWDTSHVTNMAGMFYNCYQLTDLDLSSISNWTTSSVENMSNMFYHCSGLTDLSSISDWDTSSVKNMSYMFYNCRFVSSAGNIGKWNVSSVTDMSGMFSSCSQLTTIDLSNWEISSVTDMGSMFSSCSQLSDFSFLANWDTSHVTKMGSMFYKCSQLTDLSSISNWNTSSVTNMYAMFCCCSQLTTLNISGWTTSHVTNMDSMFDQCSQLSDFSFLENWDVSSVTDMSSMFYKCSQLTELDLSGWDTSSVTDMNNMFGSCSQLSTTITIRGNVTSYTYMFNSAATAEGASITVNYTDTTETIVDEMIKTASNTSHVSKGQKVEPLA